MKIKNSKFFKIIVIFIIITLLLCNLQIFALADTQENQEVQQGEQENSASQDGNQENTESEPQDETQILENKKAELEAAVSENESQIGVVEDEISAVLAEVENLSIKISAKQQEISNIELEEVSLNSYIDEAQETLEKYTAKYEKEKALLEERLVAMYETTDIKYLDVLLKSDSLSDFLSRYYLITEITESDYELVQSVEDSKQQMESLTTSLKDKKAELEEDKLNKEKYQISLENMEILKNNKISKLNEQELEMYNKIEEYKNEISNVEAEIRQLALENIGEAYIGGSMIWPTPGYTLITSNFGMRTHPITGIYKLHSGVDIGAPYGADFVAANDGVVVKAEYNRAYGNMVIIDHGGGLTTLYGHGSEILVKEGDTVKQGNAVLKVGATGYATGPHAHFEIRINGQYIDPLKYITPDNGDNSSSIEETINSENENNTENIVN